jgi:molybdopterin synthase catalytic subunit
MPDKTGNYIRPLLKEEAGTAVSFIQKNTGDDCIASLSFCYHHAQTIFISESASNEWQGIIITYLSPAGRHIAVVENIVIALASRRRGAATELLEYSLEYYKRQCVFNIHCSIAKASDAAENLLAKFSFTACGETAYSKHLLPEKICLHNRRMRPSMNTINGEVNEDTLFEYFQNGDVIWGTYSGGTITQGVLLGRMARNGDINFQYLQLNTNNELNTGKSHSATEFLNDGRIILYEDWEWTGNKSGGGRSVIEEVKE